jgi:hypothetical protein
MGARPSSFKKGGGFLNNVDGVITNYEFTTEFPGGGGKKGKKNPDFSPLFFILSARVDGADEDAQTTLNAGNADNFEISDDGKTLTPVEEGFELSANSAVGKFIGSLCEAGFPETNLPEDAINFEAIIGTRVRFVQVVNKEATEKYGKRKSKDGKREFDRQDLKVSNVLGLPGTSKGAKATKGKAAPAAADDTDVSELAGETLMTILGETKDGNIAKAKVKMAVIRVMGGVKADNCKEVIAYLADDDNLGSIDGVDYDAKSGLISLS